jgi:hypothetical protein
MIAGDLRALWNTKSSASSGLSIQRAKGTKMPPEKPDEPRVQRESGWLIERYINGQLRFWDGRYIDDRGFVVSSGEATRFSREEDAAVVLAWLLGGHGRAAEHVWTESE